MEKIRVIMIGAGNRSRYHIKNLLNISEVEIAGFVDPSNESLETIRRHFPSLKDIPFYKDLQEAFEATESDAAVISTPHNLHFEQGMACLNRGLHVLIEKPLVSKAADAQSLMEKAREKQKHVAVAYQRHLLGPYMYIKKLIQNGDLGKINYVSAYLAQSWAQFKPKTRSVVWRLDPKQSGGGQLNDSGSHLVDVVLWMTGVEPEAVSALIHNRGTQVDIDSMVTVRCANDTMVNFNISGSATIELYEDISIHGDQGTVLLRNKTLMVGIGVNNKLAHIPEDEFPVSRNVDEDFVDVILGRRKEPAATAECGLNTIQLTEAAWRSAELGGQFVEF